MVTMFIGLYNKGNEDFSVHECRVTEQIDLERWNSVKWQYKVRKYISNKSTSVYNSLSSPLFTFSLVLDVTKLEHTNPIVCDDVFLF